MHGRSARRLASATLCAAVLAGVTGPAAVAADSTRERGRSAFREAVPGAQKLLPRSRS